LFDEIEKAHPDVFQLLLQLLEDGSITDAKGRKVDFTHTIIILTSNLGAERMQKEANLGFHAKDKLDVDELNNEHLKNTEAAHESLSERMRPELINRFDAVITFRVLTRKSVEKIFELLIDELQKRLIHEGLQLSVKSTAKRWLINKGYNEKFGARPLRRVIQDEVEHVIAEGILSGRYDKGNVLQVDVKKGMVIIDVKPETV
jgi:ATP-dependent Clp protease ATP-binding subunit ClpC